MKTNNMNKLQSVNIIKLIMLLLAVSVTLSEARGGRGRGGGSFGGLFGGWRKYKKPASSGNSRRTVNSSPVQSTVPKATSGGSSMSDSMKHSKSSYPKQQMPANGIGANGYTPMGSYYGAGGAGAAHLPPGSQYYANAAAMPTGALYYAQPPMQSSGSGNFLMGMMTGHMMSNMLFPRHYATQIYHQQAPQAQNQGSKVIIINTNNATTATDTTTNTTNTTTHALPQYWPTDTNVPLAPFNKTLTSADTSQPVQQMPATNNNNNNNNDQLQTETGAAAPQPAAEPQGIICMPMLFNETDPNDATTTISVEKIVCFPAPPPPPPQALATSSALTIESRNSKENCITGVFIETDPNDPTKTIEVKKEQCRNVTLTPEEIVGEIGENTNKK